MNPFSLIFPSLEKLNLADSFTAIISSSLEDLFAAIAARVLIIFSDHPAYIPLAVFAGVLCFWMYLLTIISRSMLDLYRGPEKDCDEDRSGKIVTRKTHPHGGEFEKSDRTPRRPPTRR